MRVEVRCLTTLNYSLVHCDRSFIESVTLINDGSIPLINLNLQFALSDYARSEPVTIGFLLPGDRQPVHPPLRLLFERHRLRDMAAPETVLLEALVNEKREALSPPVEVTVLPPNAWHVAGHKQALAGFVMPQSDAIEEIVTRSRRELRRLFKGTQGFADARESADSKAVETTVKALYYCLQERYAITYEYEPRNYALNWQVVRFHQEVLDELEGTCIDLALLFAACIENVHRDPLILLVKTGPALIHALVGCWRNRSLLGDPIFYDQTQVRSWIRTGELIVLDSTGYSRTRDYSEGMPFAACREQGSNIVEECPLVYALDIVAGREKGYAPMPLGKGIQQNRAAWLALFRARRKAESLGSHAVGARHLLLGLLESENSLLSQVFSLIGSNVKRQVIEVAQASLTGVKESHPLAWLPHTQHAKSVLHRSETRARTNGSFLITEADLLTALLEYPGQVEEVLRRCGLTPAQCSDALKNLVRGRSTTTSEWHSSGFSE